MSSRLVSMVRNLQRRKTRRRRGMAVAEGVRVVEEALEAGVELHGGIVSPALERTPRGADLLARLADRAIPVEEVPEREFADLADTDQPQGVLVLMTLHTCALDSILPQPGSAALILDAVQDPGNVGALLRTAHALGACGAVLLKGSADLSNPKVIRSAAGATFRLPVARAAAVEIGPWSERHQVTLWVTSGDGMPLGRIPVPDRLAVIVGNEGAGVDPALARTAARTVSVPLARGAESLNVAVAAGIVLHGVLRGS